MKSIMKQTKVRTLLLSALLLTGLCGAVVPAHSASIQAGSWSASGPGSTTITPSAGSIDSLVFGYSINPAGYSTQKWQFSEIAPYSGLVTFNWEHSGFHSFFDVTEFVSVFADGPTGRTTISLASHGPANCCSAPSGGFDYLGTGSLAINQGYSWGFQVGGSNFDTNNVLQGNLTLTNFTAPAPEPSVVGLVSAGLFGIVGLARKRRRKQAEPHEG